MFLNYFLPLLVSLLPLEVATKLLVVALRRLAKQTDTTFDDDLVKVLEKHFEIDPEELTK